MSGNAHEDLKISFEDSYENYDDDSVNVLVTERSSRDKMNANESLSKLKDIKLKNINHVIIAQLNINSPRNKFDFLKETVTGFVDILLISESKLDDSFPTAQFQINGLLVLIGLIEMPMAEEFYSMLEKAFIQNF